MPTAPARQQHDVVTVFALAVLVYGLAKVTHEAVGHGVACELVGGDLLGVASSWTHCDKAGVGVAGQRIIEAGGTLANLVVGGVALALVRLRSFRSGHLFAFTWLTAGVNLLIGGGYLLVDPIFSFGDWSDFLAGLEPAFAWRAGASAMGAAISLGTFFALRGPLERMLGGSRAERSRQAMLLCWLPYLGAGGVVLTGAALLNELGLQYAITSAAATLGGTFLLVWLPLAIEGESATPTPQLLVRRGSGWLVAGSVALVGLFAAFGPGIRF